VTSHTLQRAFLALSPLTGMILVLLVTAPIRATALPFTLYSAVAYSLGTVTSLLVRWQ
jgi:hypothetical protein